MPKVNYVIATYSGKIFSRKQPIEEYNLQYNLVCVDRVSTCVDEINVDKITIVCPESRGETYTNYYMKQYWEEKNKKITYMNYIGKNKHNSYDQWIQAYLAYPDYDYYIFIEDDYCISPKINMDKLLALYNELFPDNIGYLCTLTEDNRFHGYHAAISNGIISKKTMEKLGNNVLEKYYNIQGHPQATFSKLFLNDNIPIKDVSGKYNIYFYDSYSKDIRTYDSSKEDLFLPVQMVYKNLYLSHIPEIKLDYVELYLLHDRSITSNLQYIITSEFFLEKILLYVNCMKIDGIIPKDIWGKCNFQQYLDDKYLNKYNNQHNSQIVVNAYANTVVLEDVYFPAYFQYHFIEKNTPNLTDLNILNILSEYYVRKSDTIYHISDLSIKNRSYLYESINYYDSLNQCLICDYSFLPMLYTKDYPVFLIPSIIHVKETGRNVFSSEERFMQTLNQVKSIREKVLSSKIFILELSQLSIKHLNQLILYCDGIIFFNKDNTAVEYANDKNKNKAEVYLLRKMLEKITPNDNGWILKFGGRYILDNCFEKDKILRDKPVFRMVPKAYDGKPIVETILYSIPTSEYYFDEFKEYLIVMENMLNAIYTDVEHLLYDYYIKTDAYDTDYLGVKGHYALGRYNCC